MSGQRSPQEARADLIAWRSAFPSDPIAADPHLAAVGLRYLERERLTAITTSAGEFGRRVAGDLGDLVAAYQAHPPRLERYDGVGNAVEHVVFEPRNMTPEQLQEGLEWSWRQSYGWRSFFARMTAAEWSGLPLWISLNLGYRYFARHLREKAGSVYRDPACAEALAAR